MTVCLPVGRLGRAGCRLATLGPHPQPIRPSCQVPLGPAACLLYGCCSQMGVRQITAYPGPHKPCPAWGSCSQDGSLGSPSSQPLLRLLSPLRTLMGRRGRGCRAGPQHPGLLCHWRGLPSTPAISHPCSSRDTGLRVTLTLLPAGPGLGRSICSSLSVKGETGNHSAPRAQDPSTQVWARPIPPTPSHCQAGLGAPPIFH